MLFVPFITVADVNNPALIIESMQSVQENSLSCVNWPDVFPSKPEVSFKIAHSGEYLYLEFFVEEDEIKGVVTEDNGPVWTDSCVEFFLSLGDSPYYYNAEFSCIGRALLAYRKGRAGAEHATPEVVSRIKRYPSLGTDAIEKQKGDFKWSLLVAIPVSVYWNSGLTTFKGAKARANFYKCGDGLTVPHYLSWNPILTKKPDFHAPQYFGELAFE